MDIEIARCEEMPQQDIKKFNKLLKLRKYIIFHYACSDLNNYPISVSSIACFDAKENVEKKFSRTSFTEREIIENFVKYLKNKVNGNYSIIGWNIKKEIYGINPILKQYNDLTGKNAKIEITPNRVFDFDYIVKQKFKDFMGGLHNLILFNAGNMNLFLFGKEELDYLKNNNFQELDNSVMRKVKEIEKLLLKWRDDSLLIKPENFLVRAKIFLLLNTWSIQKFLKKYKEDIIISIFVAILIQLLFEIV